MITHFRISKQYWRLEIAVEGRVTKFSSLKKNNPPPQFFFYLSHYFLFYC